MNNRDISRMLNNIAAVYAIKDEKKYKFQIIAYQKAADMIENSSLEMLDLVKENKLKGFPGIGLTIKSYLEELCKNGKSEHFEALLKEISSSVFVLLDIPGFGPKKAYRLVTEFKLTDPGSVIQDLKKTALSGEIAKLSGFGEKSQSDILRSIREYQLGKTKSNRMLMPYAHELAERVINHLLALKSVMAAYALGSLRRKMPTVGDIDIAVAASNAGAVFDQFAKFPEAKRVIERGEKTSSILTTSGNQIDLMVTSTQAIGSLLQHFTGSKAHNIHMREYALSKGLSLSEYGIKRMVDRAERHIDQYDSEEKFYEALGMQWIPPEMREDKGEIELAIRHKLPRLVEIEDIKGDLHTHSSYPIEPSHDLGQNTMEDMIENAIKLKYAYIGFSEHNPSLAKHNPNQVYDILSARSKHIERLRSKYSRTIRIFSLLEIDILTNGNLAIDDKSFQLLDAGIVSIHSKFDMDKSKMTQRVLSGLSHPKAKILAHPTGRLINQRPGYELDWGQIFEYCAKNKKALEINSWPVRMDLPDNLVKEAIERGVMLVINTDSHASDHMSLMRYGVYTARRGWARGRDILNTKSYNDIKEWFVS